MDIAETRRNINDLQRLAVKILDGISDDIRTSEDRLKSEFDSKIQETVNTKNKEIESLKKSHQSELEELKRNNKKEIEKLEATIIARNNVIKKIRQAVIDVIE